MRIEISREEALLDTGGGLKRAAHFFLEGDNRSEQPFIVHNVDVLSTIDLRKMLAFHTENQALATLAVQDRVTSRYLVFDDQLQLCGRQLGSDRPELVRGCQQVCALGFSGIHVVSSRFLAMMSENGAFSIVTSYLRLAAQGETIFAFRANEYYWRDLGKPENVAQAAEDLKHKIVAQ
jgi:NDP-sugar pyrophosphorylase family protein